MKKKKTVTRDSEKIEPGFLVEHGLGWKFIRAESFDIVGHVPEGAVLINESWPSCWLVDVREPWSIAKQGLMHKRWGIPEDLAMEILTLSGARFITKPSITTPPHPRCPW